MAGGSGDSREFISHYNAAADFKNCLAADQGIGSRDRDADKIAQPSPTIYKLPLTQYLPLFKSEPRGAVCENRFVQKKR